MKCPHVDILVICEIPVSTEFLVLVRWVSRPAESDGGPLRKKDGLPLCHCLRRTVAAFFTERNHSL